MPNALIIIDGTVKNQTLVLVRGTSLKTCTPLIMKQFI